MLRCDGARKQHAVPHALVVGLGAYFRKLRSGLDSYLDVLWYSDCKPPAHLGLDACEAARFRPAGELEDLASSDSIDCVMLLTPPALHIPQFHAISHYRKPVLAEKPLLTRSLDERALGAALKINPLLYASDFYPDVRAAPLLSWARPEMRHPFQGEVDVEAGDRSLWDSGPESLGPVIGLEAKLLEGRGPQGSYTGRDWLWDPEQGGVVFDLMYHYFTLSSFLLPEPLVPERAVLKTSRDGSETIPWRRALGVSETYALACGHTRGGVPFSFEVAKYWTGRTERYFSVRYASGSATMAFANPNVFTIRSGSRSCRCKLRGDHYEHVVRGFAHYVSSGMDEPHGVDEGLAAVHACQAVRTL